MEKQEIKNILLWMFKNSFNIKECVNLYDNFYHEVCFKYLNDDYNFIEVFMQVEGSVCYYESIECIKDVLIEKVCIWEDEEIIDIEINDNELIKL